MQGPPVHLGRYALFAEIASGGMATVHIGRQVGPVGFSRIVAVKRMHPHVARDPEFVAMFLDEARIAARIRHSNVIQTVDVVAEAGELFLVMEYVEGESLSRLLRKSHATLGAPPPWRVASAIVAGVLHGLQAAHEATDEAGHPLEVVHRDVSPQNILIGVDGIARLLDFGVAKAVGRMQVTREGQLKGKLPYMAPEQIRNPAAISARTDVYGASVVAWETFTGSRLFTGDEGEVLGRVLDGKIPAPSSVEPSVPKELDDVILRGLAKDPRDRHPSARDMALAIERFGVAPASEVSAWVASLAGTQLSDRAKLVVAVESAPRSVESLAGEERTVTLPRTPPAMAAAATEPPRKQAHTGLIVGVISGALLFAIVLFFSMSRSEKNESAAGSAPAPITVAPTVSATPSVANVPLPVATPAPLPPAPTTTQKPAVRNASSAAIAKPIPNCNPPYYFQGKIKRFKPECLQK